MKRNYLCKLLTLLITCNMLHAQYVLTTDIKKPISPTMWGLFFEDINRSGDGGLYAELVKNRSFDFPDAFMGWTTNPARNQYAKNEIFQIINQEAAYPDNPKYLQVTIAQPGVYWIANEGFGGVTVQKNKSYTITLRYRVSAPGIEPVVSIYNASNKNVCSTKLKLDNKNTWTATQIDLTATDSTIMGKVVIYFEGSGQLDIDRISLFPKDTWMNRPAGLRADLAQKLADIQPGFMRFPGGCIVEGEALNTRYQWKKSIGPLEERKLIPNQWRDGGAAQRPMPDYYQSYGLGFMEYFQLCEDMKAEPMPILNAGLSCQFGAGEVVPADLIDPYVQDALDLVEFANGDAQSKWGARRAALGHPAPFNMKMIGVGNENWGPQYVERLQLFTKAIKAKYPDIQIITSTGYTPNPQFRYMDSVLRKMKVDIIDEHYYQPPQWMFMNAAKYDRYDRSGPKIFIGEYACHSIRIGNPQNKNTHYCALAEAAFMTGLERNADVVTMAAYAPLLAHVKDWQWTPNLVWFDNSTSYATPSYYVQQMFAQNKGTHTVPITENNTAVTGSDSIWASAAIDETTNEIIIKIVNASANNKTKTVYIPGLKSKDYKGTVTTLASNDPSAENNIASPLAVQPIKGTVKARHKTLSLSLPPYSFNVIKLKK
jgi:alpha-L-arabinofuranosidase